MWVTVEDGATLELQLIDPATGRDMAADMVDSFGGFDSGDFEQSRDGWTSTYEAVEYWLEQIETYQALADRIYALEQTHGRDAVQQVVYDYHVSDIDLCAYAVDAALTDFFGDVE